MTSVICLLELVLFFPLGLISLKLTIILIELDLITQGELLSPMDVYILVISHRFSNSHFDKET
jgi:hypothetical protein